MANKVAAQLFVYVQDKFYLFCDLFENSEIIFGHVGLPRVSNLIRIPLKFLAPYHLKIQHISSPTTNLIFVLNDINEQKEHRWRRGGSRFVGDTYVNQQFIRHGSLLNIRDMVYVNFPQYFRIIIAEPTACIEDIEAEEYFNHSNTSCHTNEAKYLVKGTSIRDSIESNTYYQGCTFYVQQQTVIAHSIFDNCNFRENISIHVLWNCTFINCNLDSLTILNSAHSILNGETFCKCSCIFKN